MKVFWVFSGIADSWIESLNRGNWEDMCSPNLVPGA